MTDLLRSVVLQLRLPALYSPSSHSLPARALLRSVRIIASRGGTDADDAPTEGSANGEVCPQCWGLSPFLQGSVPNVGVCPQCWGLSPMLGSVPNVGVCPLFWGLSPFLQGSVPSFGVSFGVCPLSCRGLSPFLQGSVPSFGVCPQCWGLSPMLGSVPNVGACPLSCRGLSPMWEHKKDAPHATHLS